MSEESLLFMKEILSQFTFKLQDKTAYMKAVKVYEEVEQLLSLLNGSDKKEVIT